MWKFFSFLRAPKTSGQRTNWPNKVKIELANQFVTDRETNRNLQGLVNDPRMLQQVDRQSGSGDHARLVEGHVQILAETRRIVVDTGACVAESFHDRVGHEDLVLQIAIRRLLICLVWFIYFKKGDIYFVLFRFELRTKTHFAQGDQLFQQ